MLALLILGTNAVWGLTGNANDTLVSAWLNGIAPLWSWVALIGLILAGFVTAAVARSRRGQHTLALIIAANLIGVFVSEVIRGRIATAGSLPLDTYGEAMQVALGRTTLLIPIVPMLLVVVLTGGRWKYYPLRIGDWSVRTHLFRTRASATWGRITVAFTLFYFLPLLVLFQLSVGFEPTISGKLLVLFPALTLLALLNALIEETTFRGLIMPPLIEMVGAPIGIWLQGLAFGLLHWGASPSLIAGLPLALAIGFGGVLGGKAAFEMKGLGFAVLIHMFADIAIFSAGFI